MKRVEELINLYRSYDPELEHYSLKSLIGLYRAEHPDWTGERIERQAYRTFRTLLSSHSGWYHSQVRFQKSHRLSSNPARLVDEGIDPDEEAR